MIKEISVTVEQEVLSLATDITYCCVPDWYGVSFSDLKMNLIIPKNRENHALLPAIIWICGGAFSVVSNSAWMPEMLYFARKGYVVAGIEYRTSNKVSFPGGLIDVKSAIRFLKAHAEQFCINKDKIVVMGESAGGTYACLAGMTAENKEFEKGDYLEYDSSVAAIVNFYGPSDFSITSIVQNDIVPAWTLDAFLGENAAEENVKRVSAINYVSEKTPPIMILHGTEDQTVPIEQSDRLYEKLVENGVHVKYYRIKDAVHGEERFFQNEIKDLVLDFLKDILK